MLCTVPDDSALQQLQHRHRTAGRHAITVLSSFHHHPFLIIFLHILILHRSDIYILSDDAQSGVVALSLGDSVLHLPCLVTHSVFPECGCGNAHQVEDISVLPNKRAIWFLLHAHICIPPMPKSSAS